jgi:ubiquitin C-terminal hydrolase
MVQIAVKKCEASAAVCDKPEGSKDLPEEDEPKEESESAKADREWARYLSAEDSPITQLLAGQLQSSVVCHKCNSRFTM